VTAASDCHLATHENVNASIKIFRSLSRSMVTSGNNKANQNHVINRAMDSLSPGHRFVGASEAFASAEPFGMLGKGVRSCPAQKLGQPVTT
jgi:hypothetical protein